MRRLVGCHAVRFSDNRTPVPCRLLCGLSCFQERQDLRPVSILTLKASSKNKGPLRQGPNVEQGGDLLSHPVSEAVPSVLEGLTSVFGMGTGVTPPQDHLVSNSYLHCLKLFHN